MDGVGDEHARGTQQLGQKHGISGKQEQDKGCSRYS
jgi:hypothetical protein